MKKTGAVVLLALLLSFGGGAVFAAAQTATQTFTIIVNAALAFSTGGTLPAANAGQPYSATIVITGGTAPYTAAITSGTLPTGLTLNQPVGNSASFTITGTPTT